MNDLPTSIRPVTLSVVVATYQGARRILTTLHSLERQSFRDFEVVVVIDGSTDDTEQVIRQAGLDLNLRLVVQENKGRSGARNSGVKETTTDIIVFFDDDVIVTPDVVRAYYEHYQQGYALVVGGFYPVQEEQNEFFFYSGYLNIKWGANLNNNAAGYMTTPYMSAANACIRKTVFSAAGGFDEGLRDAEDFDLAVKLFEKGIKLYYNPALEVGHHLQHRFDEYVRRLNQYKEAHKVLRGRNPVVAKYISHQPWGGSMLKKTIFRMFAFPFYIRLADAGVFRVLPKKLRYRFYDLIVTANTTDFV
jgi:glycosyltransferase involved in cell wall biosynthesis